MDRTWYRVVLFLAKENKEIIGGIAAIAASANSSENEAKYERTIFVRLLQSASYAK